MGRWPPFCRRRRVGRVCAALVMLFSAAWAERSATPPTSFTGGDRDAADAPEVVELRHDFGVVRPHSTQTAEFSIRNPTTTLWTIHRIETTCGCLAAKPRRASIAPGDSEGFEVA